MAFNLSVNLCMAACLRISFSLFSSFSVSGADLASSSPTMARISSCLLSLSK